MRVSVLRYKPSFRDLAEMIAERGLSLAHVTITRWVNRKRNAALSSQGQALKQRLVGPLWE